MSRFTDLLKDPFAEKRFLAILEPLDPRIPNPPAITPGKVVPFYFSSHGFTSKPSDTPANTAFTARMKKGYSFTRALYSKGSLSGRTVPGYGSIEILNPDGAYDDFDNLSWGGRRIRVFLGGKDFAFSEYGQIFEGTAQGISFDNEVVRIELRSLEYLFDTEIQPNLFTGTGNEEGTPDMQGRRKPKLWGVCRLFEPVYVGVTAGKQSYLINDGPIVDVTAVYDNGVLLTPVVGTPSPGQYTVTRSTGLIRLGGAPVGDVRVSAIGTDYLRGPTSTSASIGPVGASRTFNVGLGLPLYTGMLLRFSAVGSPLQIIDGRITSYDTATGNVTVTILGTSGTGTVSSWVWYAWGTTAGILRQIATNLGVTLLDDASLTQMDIVLPNEIGYWIPEGGSALEVMDAIADGTFTYWGFKRDGSFSVGYLLANFDSSPSVLPPAATYTPKEIIDISRQPTDEPSFKITMRYRRTWNMLSNVAAAAAGDPIFTQEWRQGFVVIPDIKQIWKLSKPLDYDTLFDNSYSSGVVISTILNRLAAVFGQKRGYYNVSLKAQPLLRDLGDVVAIKVPRYGLSAGKNAFVVDLDESLNGEEFVTKLGLLI